MGVLFFKAIPRPAIWGHTKVRDFFGYDDFPDKKRSFCRKRWIENGSPWFLKRTIPPFHWNSVEQMKKV